MGANGRNVLICGVSTRAAAASAARAGFAVTAIDAFGDLDQHETARVVSMPRDFGKRFTPLAAARAARTMECDAAAYLSNFENHPRAVDELARGRSLWGNPTSVLRQVRDPMLLASTLRQRGFAVPAVACRPEGDAAAWLVKPVASGGGRGVRRWRPPPRSDGGGGSRLPRGCYLQELMHGTPGSVVFVAARGRTVPLGVSRQLTGEAAFGAAGFQYCGNILASSGDPQFASGPRLIDAASRLARAVSEEFDLVGVNGIDFVARDGVPYPIEVNPRWSASVELVQRAFGLSAFGAHAAACVEGAMPAFDLRRELRGIAAVGKAVVFARGDVVLGDTRHWIEDSSVADVPHPGERIAAGRPICTVFASGADAAGCHAALVRRAERVYAELERAGPKSRTRPMS